MDACVCHAIETNFIFSIVQMVNLPSIWLDCGKFYLFYTFVLEKYLFILACNFFYLKKKKKHNLNRITQIFYIFDIVNFILSFPVRLTNLNAMLSTLTAWEWEIQWTSMLSCTQKSLGKPVLKRVPLNENFPEKWRNFSTKVK